MSLDPDPMMRAEVTPMRDGSGQPPALRFRTTAGLEFHCDPARTLDITTLRLEGRALDFPGNLTTPHAAGLGVAISGFMVTCGYDNVRQPTGALPLHGSLPQTPAQLTGYGGGGNQLFCTGTVLARDADGGVLRLERRITAPAHGLRLTVADRVTNISTAPVPFRVLYHINLARHHFDRARLSQPGGYSHEVATDDPTLAQARCFPLDPTHAATARLEGPHTALTLQFDSRPLPYLQIWADQLAGGAVFAIEPVNCDRNADGTSGPGPLLATSESWTAALSFAFHPPSHRGDPFDGHP